MKSLVKRISCFVMALVMVCLFGATSASAATLTPSSPLKKGEIITVDNLSYKVLSTNAKKTVQFVGVKNAAEYVSIPAEIKVSNAKYKVISIAKNALRQDPDLKELKIGKNVTSIYANAFRDCKSLKKIVVYTTKLSREMTGKNIVKGIAKNAKIYVPRTKYSSYKKLFNNGGANYYYTY